LDRKRYLKHFRDLEVYQRAFKAAMTIFQMTKEFPAEERNSLVDQIIAMLNSMENKAEKFCF
jgi:hypothetical protein